MNPFETQPGNLPVPQEAFPEAIPLAKEHQEIIDAAAAEVVREEEERRKESIQNASAESDTEDKEETVN